MSRLHLVRRFSLVLTVLSCLVAAGCGTDSDSSGVDSAGGDVFVGGTVDVRVTDSDSPSPDAGPDVTPSDVADEDVEPTDAGDVSDASMPETTDVTEEDTSDAVDEDTGSTDAADTAVDVPDAAADVSPDTTPDAVVDADTGVPLTPLVPLYDETTELDPPLQEINSTALITRFADRARDRHAREDEFQAYDHYLPFYWEHRTTTVEIVDTVPYGGDTITFNVTTQWPLRANEAELRFFYRGIGTVAEYHSNGIMTSLGGNDYTRSISANVPEGRELRVGDRMEFELSQFLNAPPRGRVNYYGTTFLYIVGEGIVPWEARGVFGDFDSGREDSFPIPVQGRIGGGTTLPYQYSNEPESHFLQMATNLAPQHGQTFVLGRRVHHTRMDDGTHTESAENPVFTELVGVLGGGYVNDSCVSCHMNNGRGLPPAVGSEPSMYGVHVGRADGSPDPNYGALLQPRSTTGAPEGTVVLSRWIEEGGLRSPEFTFPSGAPEAYDARIAPPLVGIGLLEAIDEADVAALADPEDADGDGISGRMRLLTDPVTGDTRLGRFGWKGSRASVLQQVTSALNTDMGVMSSIFPAPDCGSAQGNCGPTGSEIADVHVNNLTAYVSLLGVRARRGLADPIALQGEALFGDIACTSCHVDSFVTSPHHPHAELRGQTISPYTDLLLHDMGPGLASTLPEGNASAAEWRTAPLWGIGLTAAVGGEESYLHDGRARTLDEAIRWHGGEGAASRDAYLALTESEQAAVVAFLQTL